jgi:CheY-like chemotaxis protein
MGGSTQPTPETETEEAERPSSCVLVVDDEPTFREVMELTLTACGVGVVLQAASAAEALAVLQVILPDVIVTDLMMPGMDGLDLIRHIRAQPHGRRIPTIAVSARPASQSAEAARLAGADAWLSKPFSARELRVTLGRFLPVAEGA